MMIAFLSSEDVVGPGPEEFAQLPAILHSFDGGNRFGVTQVKKL
jgi:hypothetical protein